ncbi:hypothetical protein LZ32DRAFT_692232 [Colletotrichum eremochloae]|nr:hypothetical protein LZ32DRAFT_692232 [Colletotrichum eremochloae]
MSSATVQTPQSDVFPPNINANEVGDFQYDLGITSSPSAGGGGHEWTDNFEDPLLKLLQEHDAKLMPTEWMNAGALGFLDHNENVLAAGPHDLPLSPTTIDSLPTNTDDSWASGHDQGLAMWHAEPYTADTLPSSPGVNVGSSEPPIKRLIDLQSLLLARRMANSQETEDLSALVNTAVHATETLIDVAQSLPPLKPSAEATQPASPTSPWGQALDASPFPNSTPTQAAPELHDPHQRHRQQHPELALTISLFTTVHLLLLESYDQLLVALGARLQCSRQSRMPSPGSDNINLPRHLFSNASAGHVNKFNFVSSSDLDVNSVVFLLSRMMKRLQKSIQDRFAQGPVVFNSNAHLKFQRFPFSNASLNFDFQESVSQDIDGSSDLSPPSGHSSMMNMGGYASAEVSIRHQNVMESLRVIRWLADEL